MRGRRGLLLAACVAAAVVGVGPASAATTGRALVPAPGSQLGNALLHGFRVPVSGTLDARPSSAAAVDRSEWWGGPVVTSTGETVTVYASDAFPQTPENDAARVSWANFFAKLYHGTELGTVTIYVAPYYGVQVLCGSTRAVACYFPSPRYLVFPGDVDVGIAADAAAHEYGHHIAASRRNDPWDANAWGPKRWASYAGVCARVAGGTAFPGAEDEAHYSLNPGEAFAEANRLVNIAHGGTWANLPVVVDPSFAPNSGSMAAALADIQQPWVPPTATGWDGRFGAPPPPPVTKANASVGPGSRISLVNVNGARIRSLKAGAYVLTVRDLTAKDNFHLTGPGVDRKTGVAGKGTAVWKLNLVAGKYRYRSDAHLKLGGTFTVGPAVLRATARVKATFPPQEQTIATPLDGTFQATITGTAAATLELVDPATGQDLVPPTAGAITFTLCGHRSVLLRVAAAQAGTFHVDIVKP